MAQSIMMFDFGTNEEAAQQARQKVERWKQGFRLGNKIQLKFERQESAEQESLQPEKAASAESKPGKKKSPASDAKEGSADEKAASGGRVRVLVRLAFSEHEKISNQRWLDRIPAEEPFKSAKAETVHPGDAAFDQLSELFDSLGWRGDSEVR
jgi:hypothetical protein